MKNSETISTDVANLCSALEKRPNDVPVPVELARVAANAVPHLVTGGFETEAETMREVARQVVSGTLTTDAADLIAIFTPTKTALESIEGWENGE